ncbi:MAG: aspartate--tRNA ligase dps1 [Chaenotheca gracillima]|nr:MAG: aspartate--tRNA ligase dps1 [Chaenotheca gracillima]
MTRPKKRKPAGGGNGGNNANNINKRQRTDHVSNGGQDDDDEQQQRRAARVDATTGMRGAFPELDDFDEEDGMFYGPASSGLEYLRMVRSEAKGVPNLLVAPKDSKSHTATTYSQEDTNGNLETPDSIESGGGHYFDGAYTAAPRPEATKSQGYQEDDHLDTQEAYDSALMLRYRLLRANLRCMPSPEATARLDTNTHPSHVRGNSKAELAGWRHLLRTTTPVPAQIALMDQASIFALLKIVTASFIRRKENLTARMSCWIWSLLGRVEEIGCLNSDEVSVIRDLGKKTVWVIEGVRRKAAELTEGPEGSDLDADEGEEYGSSVQNTEKIEEIGKSAVEPHSNGVNSEDIEAVKARLLAHLPSSSGGLSGTNEQPEISNLQSVAESRQGQPEQEEPEDGEIEEISPSAAVDAAAHRDAREAASLPFPSKHTLGTLYVILTIVGECYGQRDLLEFREVWEEDLGGHFL